MVGRAFTLTLAVASLLGVSLPAAAGASQPPRAALEDFVCTPARNQLNRVIEITAVMRPVRGTQRMELRFVLQRRWYGRIRFSPVHGRGLGSWLTPQRPTLGQIPSDVWVFNKPVVNLAGPAVYRFQVTFRWLGRRGVVGNQTLLSPPCTQPR